MALFLCRLIPSRSTFPGDITEEERGVMAAHRAKWHGLLEEGKVVVFGPVDDPAGTWGLGVVEADTADEVAAMFRDDPAVTSGLNRFEVVPFLRGYARPAA